jgi:hypothetical protein
MKKAIIILLALISLISCKPQKITVERITTDTTIIREVPKIIEVPGAVIQSPSINIDSLVQLIKSDMPVQKINQTLIREDPETKLRVGLLIDELGNLTALCEQQDRLIEIQSQEITRLKKIIETHTITVKPTWWDQLKEVSIYLLIGFVIGATILSLKSIVKY